MNGISLRALALSRLPDHAERLGEPLKILIPTLPVLIGALWFGQVPLSSAQSTPDAGSPMDAQVTEAAQRVAFDPAGVGLPGFLDPRSSGDDFNRALALIDERLAELETPLSDLDQGESENFDDPRIARLEELHAAVQRGSVVAARIRAFDESVALSIAEIANGALVDVDPPFNLALLDRLHAEKHLAEVAHEDKSRLRRQAERRLEAIEPAYLDADRERRQARDRLAQSEEPGERVTLARALEQAQLAVLVAFEARQTAQYGVSLAQREESLAAAVVAQLAATIARVAPDVVFTREELDERLAEVQAREQALRARIQALIEAGDAAELAWFETRQRWESATDEAMRLRLEAETRAREAELTAARQGVEYLHQTVGLAGSVSQLLERRHALFVGAETEQWSVWLREVQDLVAQIDREQSFAQTELDALRMTQLGLERRLTLPDLGEELLAATTAQIRALEQQERDARERLAALDQTLALAEPVRNQLQISVRERSLAQHFAEARTQLDELWDREVFVFQDHGIDTRDLVMGLVVFALVLMLVSSLRFALRRVLLPKLTNGADPERRTYRAGVLALIRNTHPVFVLIVAFYAAMKVSGLVQGQVQVWLWTLLVIAFYLQLGIWATAALVDFVQRQRSRKERLDPSAVTGYGLLLFFLRVGVWIVVAVSVLAHFKYPIAGLIGALGVGGIAVAFAVQNILSDIFHSMAIILDKPFKVGDFVVAGEIAGVIDNIGVKTTRIRSLSGEMVVMSNTQLLGSTIRNFKPMRERRVVFKLGVIYQTSAEQLERLPKMIEEIVRAQRLTRFDRAHFMAYGDFALEFEVVYYVIGADYGLYMDIQQAINLALYRRFQQEGIQFAYPTQEVIVRRSPVPVPG